MSHVFSTDSVENFMKISEDAETRHVTLTTELSNGAAVAIEVEAEDLARALFTASPAFSQQVGDFVQGVILNTLGTEDEPDL